MRKREMINYVNREKRMADLFGHSKDLITLSLRYSPTVAYTLLRHAGTRVKIRLSLHPCKGSHTFYCNMDSNNNK